MKTMSMQCVINFHLKDDCMFSQHRQTKILQYAAYGTRLQQLRVYVGE